VVVQSKRIVWHCNTIWHTAWNKNTDENISQGLVWTRVLYYKSVFLDSGRDVKQAGVHRLIVSDGERDKKKAARECQALHLHHQHVTSDRILDPHALELLAVVCIAEGQMRIRVAVKKYADAHKKALEVVFGQTLLKEISAKEGRAGMDHCNRLG